MTLFSMCQSYKMNMEFWIINIYISDQVEINKVDCYLMVLFIWTKQLWTFGKRKLQEQNKTSCHSEETIRENQTVAVSHASLIFWMVTVYILQIWKKSAGSFFWSNWYICKLLRCRGAVRIFNLCKLSTQNYEYFTNSIKWLPTLFI